MITDPPPPAAIQPPKKKNSGRWKAILLLLFVFALGNLTGAGGAALIALKRLRENLRSPIVADGAGTRFLKRVNRDLDKDLKLDPAEREAVREELEVTRARLGELRANLLRDARSLSGDTVRRISQRLPEEKRALLRQRVRERLGPWGIEPPDDDGAGK